MSTGFTPLDERARTLFHLQGLWTLLAFWVPACALALGGLLALPALLGAPLSFPVAAGLVALLFGSQLVRTVVWPVLATPRWGWRLEPDVLLIRRGVVFRSVVAIPRTRIQHVDVRQGPLDQLVGLARLQVHTASGLGPDGTLPGLDPEVAEGLRKQLLTGLRSDDGV
jgi:membrane protein YdbS with pleckstrin-like domain